MAVPEARRADRRSRPDVRCEQRREDERPRRARGRRRRSRSCRAERPAHPEPHADDCTQQKVASSRSCAASDRLPSARQVLRRRQGRQPGGVTDGADDGLRGDVGGERADEQQVVRSVRACRSRARRRCRRPPACAPARSRARTRRAPSAPPSRPASSSAARWWRRRASVVFSAVRGADGGVRAQQPARVGQRIAVLGAHAGDDCAGRRIDDVAEGVDRRRARRRRGRSAARSRALPMPPFIARCEAARNLPTVAPAPAPTLPSATGRGARGRGRAIAAVRGRPDPRVADAEVEQDRGWHNRHARDGRLEADVRARRASARRQRPHRARTRCRRPARSRSPDRRCYGIEQIGLARAGRGAAHIDAADGCGAGQDHGAAGRALGQA